MTKQLSDLMSRTIIVIGDSHTDAVKRALANRSPDGRTFRAFRWPSVKNGKNIGDLSEPELYSLIKDLQSTDIVASTLGGNQHQVVSLIQHPVPFDVYNGSAPIQKPRSLDSVTIIPNRQIYDWMESGLRGRDGTRLNTLKAKTQARVMHLAPPPPKKNAAHILARCETAFQEAGISKYGVTDASTRQRIWAIQIKALKSLTTEWGIELINNPSQTVTDDGFLDEIYYANDATHANTLYGERIIQQLIALQDDSRTSLESV